MNKQQPQTQGSGKSGNEQKEKHLPEKPDKNRVPPPPDAQEKTHSGYYAQTFEDGGDTTAPDGESPQPARETGP